MGRLWGMERVQSRALKECWVWEEVRHNLKWDGGNGMKVIVACFTCRSDAEGPELRLRYGVSEGPG